jgi:hypothetical protein
MGARGLLGQLIRAAGCGFYVIEFGLWRPHHLLASRTEPQAEVNIIEGNWELNVFHTAQSLIVRFTQNQTGRCDAGVLMQDVIHPGISKIVTRPTITCVDRVINLMSQ